MPFSAKFVEQKGAPDLIKSAQTTKGNTLGACHVVLVVACLLC
jgi:hypothetical protein